MFWYKDTDPSIYTYVCVCGGVRWGWLVHIHTYTHQYEKVLRAKASRTDLPGTPSSCPFTPPHNNQTHLSTHINIPSLPPLFNHLSPAEPLLCLRPLRRIPEANPRYRQPFWSRTDNYDNFLPFFAGVLALSLAQSYGTSDTVKRSKSE